MRRPRRAALYAIADRRALSGRLPEAVEAIVAAGIGWVQIRAKECPGAVLESEVEECCRRLEGASATLWIDDRVDLAAAFPVAGVHLGRHDLPPVAARGLVGSERLIGASTHDASQVAEAAADEAVDVVAVGPVYETSGKQSPDPVVGLELIREARRMTDKPLVAIGGITARTVAEVVEAGADLVAVLGAVCTGDLVPSCRALQSALEAAV